MLGGLGTGCGGGDVAEIGEGILKFSLLRNIISFSLPLQLLFPPSNFFTLVIMVQVSPPSSPSPSGSTGSVAGSGLLERLQAASLQADPPVSSSSDPSIPSLRNGSPLLTTLRERTVEDELTDGKRGDLQPGESLLGESRL